MDGEMGPPISTATTDVVAAAAYPAHDSDFTPVGSPDETLVEAHALPSDDDHLDDHEEHDHNNDHDHDHDDDPDLDHNQDQVAGPTVQAEDLKLRVIKQVEYYFSDENLSNDKYMTSLIGKNKEGYVPITVIAAFRRMKKLTRDHAFIVAALKESSSLVVSLSGKTVKRLHPFEITDPKTCTVLVENLPEDHSVENIQRIFGEVGRIRNISIRDPRVADGSKKGWKEKILISSKLHALVEYDTVEAAEKAVAMLNDEKDWRNGMQVKLLKRVGKNAQRKQAWREADPEKNVSGRASNQTGDGENHNPSEHHNDIPDEEDGEHLSKDKNGHHGRNQGRPKRNKYRVTNGLGHGTTSRPPAHAAEHSKPPPGPKMPDGTRGFTMGRGRPPVLNPTQQ